MADLDVLIDRLRALQGAPEERMQRSLAVTRFIATLHDKTRVFCRGEVRTEKGHYPAVLTHNSIYGQTLAWAPSGKKMAMESHPESRFWSDIPHVGIAREVLSGPETRVLVQDIRKS